MGSLARLGSLAHLTSITNFFSDVLSLWFLCRGMAVCVQCISVKLCSLLEASHSAVSIPCLLVLSPLNLVHPSIR